MQMQGCVERMENAPKPLQPLPSLDLRCEQVLSLSLNIAAVNVCWVKFL